jgi:hypothetical protein
MLSACAHDGADRRAWHPKTLVIFALGRRVCRAGVGAAGRERVLERLHELEPAPELEPVAGRITQRATNRLAGGLEVKLDVQPRRIARHTAPR